MSIRHAVHIHHVSGNIKGSDQVRADWREKKIDRGFNVRSLAGTRYSQQTFTLLVSDSSYDGPEPISVQIPLSLALVEFKS
jgi:hypothetical protein